MLSNFVFKAPILLFCLFFTTSLLASGPLSGTYTLNSGQPNTINNFNSFDTLVSRLNSQGVSGSVLINVAGGTYNEQIFFNDISGTSATNSIRIQADPNDSIRPVITFSATSSADDYIVKLTRVSHLTMSGLSFIVGDTMYGNVIDLSGGFNHHITFENDSIITLPEYFAGSNSWPLPVVSENFIGGVNHHLSFRKNYIYGGMTSFRMRAGTSNLEAHIVIDSNEIVGWRNQAFLLEDYDDVSLTNNIINGLTIYGGHAIDLQESEGSEILNNDIEVTGGRYGVLLDRCLRCDVVGNKIFATNLSSDCTGLDIRDSEGTAQDRSLIANNMIALETHTYTHYWAGRDDAIGLKADNSSYTDYVNNSINIFGDSAWSVGLMISLPNGFFSNATANNFYNNNVINRSKGYAVMANFSSYLDGVDSLNNNNYFTNGNILAEHGTAKATLQQWQASTMLDNNTLNLNIPYFSNIDLHTNSALIDRKAKPLAYLSEDFDGEARSSVAPDIGADEFFICVAPNSLSVDSLAARFVALSWASNKDTTFCLLTNLSNFNDTAFIDTTGYLNLNWLSENTSYKIDIWHSCPLEGDFSDTISLNFTTPICPVPMANFNYQKNLLGVSFNSSTSTSADSLYWDFGDGNYSALANPIHQYNNEGLYLVRLSAYNYTCGDTSYTDSLLRVCDSLQAGISYNWAMDTLFIDAGTQRNFYSYYWDFGDGYKDTGFSASHVYAQEGIYQLSLRVFNLCGDSLISAVNIPYCTPSLASFNYQILHQDTAGVQVQFDGTSSLNTHRFIWDFGDGSVDSTNLSPLHIYPPGINMYNVKLRVYNACFEGDSSSLTIDDISIPQISLTKTVKVFPNPANEFLTIDLRGFHYVTQIELWALNSEKVMTYSLSNNIDQNSLLKFKLNPNISDGLYHLVIIGQEEYTPIKILIERP